MSVFRARPLPDAPAVGRLIVPEVVADATLTRLQSSQGVDGPHEGLVLWAGRRDGHDAIVAAAVAIESDHGWGHVRIAEIQVGRAARAMRRHGLILVAQVHSHPGSDTRHSDGDDDLIVLRHDGMFSLVVADYGRDGLHGGDGLGVHQLQGGAWIRVSDTTTAVLFAPTVIEASAP
jgi:hypothetical protein